MKNLNVRNKSPLLTEPISPSEDLEFQTFLKLAELPDVKTLHLDTESDGNSLKDGSGKAIGISIDIAPNEHNAYSYYFPFRHPTGNLSPLYLAELKKLIEKKGKWVAQNFRHDWLALQSLGIDPPWGVECTMLMAHSVNENMLSYSLDALSRGLGYEGKTSDKHFKNVINLLGWGGVPPEGIFAEYAATDASLLRPVAEEYVTRYWNEDESNGETWENDKKLAIILNKMESAGAKVDLKLAEREIERGEKRMQELANDIGLNPGSPPQLQELIFERLGVPINDKFRSPKTGAPSLNKQAMEYYEEKLEELGSPVAQQVLEYRGYQKAVSSYWKAYLTHVSADGRIRPNFNLHRTKTHRLSCDTPNLQQIPRITEKPWNRLVKPGFIAEDGYELWEADYSQIELRLTAVYAKERELIAIFEDADRDLFTEISKRVGFDRSLVKTAIYATGYGAGYDKLASIFGSMQAGRSFKEEYYNSYPGIKTVTNLASKTCKGQGFVRTWTGRRRHFRDPQSEAHKAFNSVIQGGAADIIKRRMIAYDEREGIATEECRVILQVHDSLVFEIRKDKVPYYKKVIKQIMEDVVPDFGVPFRVDLHPWGQ